jgi:hypothetical protein
VELPREFVGWPVELIYLIPPIAFILMGGLITARQPRNAYGWTMIAAGIGQGSLQAFWTSFGIYAYHVAPEVPLLAFLAFLVIPVGWTLWLCMLPLLLLLFPTGRLPSPRWKFLLWILAVAFTLISGFGWLTNTSVGWIATDNPYALAGIAGQALEALLILAVVVIFLLIIISIVSLLIRAWRSVGLERQQYKWFAYAVAIFLIYFITDFFWEPPQPWEAIKEAIPLVFLALAVGIAVLRYRLFDIDVIIRKTLVYGILTAALSLVFFGGVALLQQILGGVTGTENSPIAIVLSTLAIAALFNPLRRRVQDFIDRRFYRKKYNAELALAHFAAVARNETDIEELCAELVDVVQETMQPEMVGLWLVKGKRKRLMLEGSFQNEP